MLYFHTILSILKIIRNLLTQSTSAKLLWMSCRSTLYLLLDQILIVCYTRITTMSFRLSLLLLIPCTNTLYDFPVSVELAYLDVLSTRRQLIHYSKYHNFLCLYNHSDFIKMHMHNAWLLRKSDLTIELPSVYFTKPKYLFMFCGTLTLNQVCNNRDANTFDYHSFLFTASYLMIRDSFMLQMLKGSGSVSFRLNNTILPALYALLNIEFDFSRSQTWFESRFKFYNHDFVCSIKHLPYQAFRRRFLNFECHN